MKLLVTRFIVVVACMLTSVVTAKSSPTEPQRDETGSAIKCHRLRIISAHDRAIKMLKFDGSYGGLH